MTAPILLRRLLLITAAVGPACALGAQGSFGGLGTGCPGARGRPVLSATGTHQIGTATQFRVAPLPRSGPGWLLVGSSSSKWGTIPLPLDIPGMSGCKLFISPDIATLYAPGDAGGVFAGSIPVPDDLKLVNLPLFLQHLAYDPGTSTPIKLVVSNGGRWLIGCKNGPKRNSSGRVIGSVPGISAVGCGRITFSGNHYGPRWWACCGRYSRVRSCMYQGLGTMSGGSGEFIVPVSSFLSKVNSDVYTLLKAVSGGNLSCSTTLGIKHSGLSLRGQFGCYVNGCSQTHRYTGGSPFYGSRLSGGGTVKASIKIGWVKKSFSFPIYLTDGTPGGGWTMEPSPYTKGRYRLRIDAAIRSLKFGFSVKIPIINKKISRSFTVDTPSLKGSVATTLAIPTVCK